jgi:K+-transporting ATPase ATPase A chain
MAAIAVLVPLFTALVGTAVAVMVEAGRAGVANPAHGFPNLYAFSSASGNRSAPSRAVREHAVLQHGAGNRVLRPLLDHRSVLALAGSLVAKRSRPAPARCRHTPMFIFPRRRGDRHRRADFLALALGPIVEHLVLYGIK